MHDSFPRWIGVAAALIVVDQASKLLVLRLFRVGESVDVTPFFNLVLVYNSGAAFSFLADAGGWQRWFFASLAVLVSGWIVWLLRRHADETLFALSLALILGGALGNVIDRLRLGAVVDFFDFHAFGWHWPAFNVADSAITVGAALIVWDQVRRKEPAAEKSALTERR